MSEMATRLRRMGATDTAPTFTGRAMALLGKSPPRSSKCPQSFPASAGHAGISSHDHSDTPPPPGHVQASWYRPPQ